MLLRYFATWLQYSTASNVVKFSFKSRRPFDPCGPKGIVRETDLDGGDP